MRQGRLEHLLDFQVGEENGCNIQAIKIFSAGDGFVKPRFVDLGKPVPVSMVCKHKRRSASDSSIRGNLTLSSSVDHSSTREARESRHGPAHHPLRRQLFHGLKMSVYLYSCISFCNNWFRRSDPSSKYQDFEQLLCEMTLPSCRQLSFEKSHQHLMLVGRIVAL